MKKKRLFLCCAIAVLAVLLAVTAVLWRSADERRKAAEQALNDRVSALYYSVSTGLGNLDASLSKLSVSATPARHALLLADIWQTAGSAQEALSNVPSSHADTYPTTQFVTRVGDYAYALLTQVLRGAALSEEDRKQLASLREHCGAIKTQVDDALDGGSLPDGQLAEGGYYAQKDEEASIPEYPRLIYDGPFSESNENAVSPGPTGDPVTETQATEIARAWFPNADVRYDGVGDGQVRTHRFTVRDGDAETTLALTEAGGHLWYFMGSPEGTESGAPSDAESEKLHRAAQAFLTSHGYGQMHPSYAQYYAGTVVLNYAAKQDGVILYSDLVKVYVDRATERVIGMDASGYVQNHRRRQLEPPAITEEQARAAVSQNITLASVALAFIPKTAGTEVLCYECKGTVGDAFYIVYINAADGQEEDIFEVINSQEGDLVV